MKLQVDSVAEFESVSRIVTLKNRGHLGLFTDVALTVCEDSSAENCSKNANLQLDDELKRLELLKLHWIQNFSYQVFSPLINPIISSGVNCGQLFIV